MKIMILRNSKVLYNKFIRRNITSVGTHTRLNMSPVRCRYKIVDDDCE